jgi:hypothetical protein
MVKPLLKRKATFKERLAAFAEDAQRKADELPPGAEREALMRKASQADTASHLLEEWVPSPRLQPSK